MVQLNMSSLRAAAAPVFSKPDFRTTVRWAGVFGSFANGIQTRSSRVRVVVISTPDSEKISNSRLSLRAELSRVWGRQLNITFISDGQLLNLIEVQAVLCSRTLARSDQDDEVVRLRNEARDILDSGLAKFKEILAMIQRAQSLVQGLEIEACNYSTAFLHAVVHPIMLTITN
jgi:predicted nucleotidyltransferase